jgi:Fic-DOC domain mobile mystery protein B
MFGKVWAWAGEFRKSNKNIGVDQYRVPEELYTLLGNCRFWAAHQTYPPDEAAIRFKHELVKIHCFANGNGRHSRLMGDIIVEHVFNRPIFSWGKSYDLNKRNAGREKYLAAIKAADNGDINPLLLFARN